MRRLSAAVILLLALAACQGDPVAQVQEQTKRLCGFVPLASTVAPILDTLANTGGAATIVATAAKGICEAVTRIQAHALLGSTSKPTFNGVIIEGEFVK